MKFTFDVVSDYIDFDIKNDKVAFAPANACPSAIFQKHNTVDRDASL